MEVKQDMNREFGRFGSSAYLKRSVQYAGRAASRKPIKACGREHVLTPTVAKNFNCTHYSSGVLGNGNRKSKTIKEFQREV